MKRTYCLFEATKKIHFVAREMSHLVLGKDAIWGEYSNSHLCSAWKGHIVVPQSSYEKSIAALRTDSDILSVNHKLTDAGEALNEIVKEHGGRSFKK